MNTIIRCQSTCPHDDQCTLAAGHEPALCNHHFCACNEANIIRRPDWDHYFMAHARLASLRGSCNRKQVGAVLVVEKRVIATGYNGSPAGVPSCLDVGHQLVTFQDGSKSCVRTIHAEHNAILQCAQVGVSTLGSTIYTTASPCQECLKAIIQACIAAIVFADQYDSARSKGIDLPAIAEAHGVSWRHLA